MKKNISYLYSIAKIFVIVSFLLSPLQIKAQAPDDDAFLEEMLKSLERSLAGEAEKEEFEPQPLAKESTEKKEAPIKKTTEYKHKTVEERFLNPDYIETTAKEGKILQSPTKKSRLAYDQVMDKFVGQIKQIETHLDSFSPEFRESFITKYLDKIDQLEIAHGLIKSKKAYQAIFLSSAPEQKALAKSVKSSAQPQLTELTPAQIQQLRQRIINASKTATQMIEKLKSAAALKEMESATKLQEFATTTGKDLKISKPAKLKPKSRRHAAPVKKPVVKTEPIINEVK